MSTFELGHTNNETPAMSAGVHDPELTARPAEGSDRKSYDLTATNARIKDLGEIIGNLKAVVSIEDVATALDLPKRLNLQRTGKSWQGDCPTGHASTDHRCFSIDLDKKLYHCFNCKAGGDIVQLVQLDKGMGLIEAVRWIADGRAQDVLADLDANVEGMPPEERQRHERGRLYERIARQGRRWLYEPGAAVELAYLVSERKYDRQLIEGSPWVYWPKEQEIRDYLLKELPADAEAIKALPLTGGNGDNFRLALPYRDRNGMVLGFVKRHASKAGHIVDGVGRRWDSTKGLTKSDLFGLNTIRNMPEVLLVEGYPDAAYLPQLGLKNVVALGTATFSDSFVDGLVAKDVRRLILALDNDGGTGHKNTEASCRKFAGTDIQVFVIDPSKMAPHKDPDEYVVANGVDALKDLMDKAESSARWLTGRILDGQDLTTDLGTTTAIDEVLRFADTLKNPIDAEACFTILQSRVSVTQEVLEERFEQIQMKEAEDNFRENVKKLGSDLGRLARAENAVEAIEKVLEDTPALIQEYRRSLGDKPVGLTEFLDQKQSTDAARIPGQVLGYRLAQFPQIEAAMCGVQPSMVTIAADPNVGKTILLVNLAIDLLNSNPEAGVLFYSMDDSRDAIVSRLLAKLSGLAINDVQRKAQSSANEALITDAYRWLKDMATAGRLDIQEQSESTTMGSITQAIRTHRNKSKLVCLIDGIFNVPLEGSYPSIREENIQRANALKDIVKLHRVPLIVTAELRKRTAEDATRKTRTIHDIMETGKYGYNADVILLMTPHDPQMYGVDPEPIVDLEFAKNKLSAFKGVIPMKFTKAKATFAQASVGAGATSAFSGGKLTMGHVARILDIMRMKGAQPVSAVPSAPATYNLPGLKDPAGVTPENIAAYQREYTYSLQTRNKHRDRLKVKRLKKGERDDLRRAVREAEEQMEKFAMLLGNLSAIERENGFPEVIPHGH